MPLCVLCAVAVLTSTVFLICSLSLSVGQNVTSAVSSNVTRPTTADSSTSHTDVTLAVTSTVNAVTTVLHTTTAASASRSEVYLKRTVSYGSPLNLSVVLDVRSSFELSFRTCSHGSLLLQSGGDERNYFQLVLDESGSLNVSLSSATASKSMLLGRQLNDNQYYKFVWTYQRLGNVTVSVEQSAAVLDEMVLSGPTFDQDLWNINLNNGSELHVGDGWFEGCLRDGPQMWFSSAAEVDDAAIQWDSCPSEIVCNQTVNGCASSQCSNDARFDKQQVSYAALQKTYL